MKTESIKEIEFKDLGNESFSIQTPSHHIALNNIVLCVAKKQSGKTYFISNLLNQLKECKCMDRIFCISDTFDSNKKMMESLDIDKDDVYSPNDKEVIKKIIAKIDQERDDILEYRQKLQIFRELKKVYNTPSFLQENVDLFSEYINPITLKWKPPYHKYGGRKPTIGIFCDDIQSSLLIGNKSFRNLCIKHRHVGSFENGEPPIGCSLFIAVQNYTAQGNEGIPKSIRGNCNCVAVWKSANWKEIDLLTTELSGVIPKEKILEAYNYVMDKDPDCRHNFLFIDLTKKKEHPSPFRMNYTDWILD